MTGRTEIELVLDRYLADGAERVPDRVIDAALDEIDGIPQRRLLNVLWTIPAWPPFIRPALAGAALVVAVALGWSLLERQPNSSVGDPAGPTPSPSVSPAPPAGQRFSSPLYGYSVEAPRGWRFEPATKLWIPVEGQFGEAPMDFVVSRDEQIRLRAGSGVIPEGAAVDDWIARFITHTPLPECGPPRDTLELILIDGQPGRLRDNCGEVEATVVVGQRVYAFTLWVNQGTSPSLSGGRSVFDQLASTIRLSPEDAAGAESPAPS